MRLILLMLLFFSTVLAQALLLADPRASRRVLPSATGSCPPTPVLSNLPNPLPPSIASAIKSFEATILNTTQGSDVVGVTASLQYQGQVLSNVVSGQADRSAGSPVTPDTPFRIGSVSKVFAALLAYIAASKGAIHLDDPVQLLAPELNMSHSPVPGASQGFTWRQLLEQRSGLQREAPAGPNTTDSMLKAVAETYLIRQPGKQPSYSNLGFSIVGNVIAERALGLSFADAVTAHIVKPLGLGNTGVVYTPQVLKRLAHSYGPNGDPVPFQPLGWSDPAGGLYSTPHDLNTVAWALQQAAVGQGPLSPVLTVAVATELLDVDWRNGDGETIFGAPWESSVHGQFVVRRKGGNLAGYSTLLSFQPDTGLSVAAAWSWATAPSEFESSLAVWTPLLPSFADALAALAPSPFRPGPSPQDFVGTFSSSPGGLEGRVAFNVTGEGALLLAVQGVLSVYINVAPASFPRNDTFQVYVPPSDLGCLTSELLGFADQLVFFARGTEGTVANFTVPGLVPGLTFVRV